jgi:signal transduction histidine kinase
MPRPARANLARFGPETGQDRGVAAPRTAPAGPRLVADVCGALAALAGAVVVAGWFARAERVVQAVPGQAPMQFNTAVALLLLGVALVLVRRGPRAASPVLAGLVLLLAGVTVAEHVLDRALGVDTLLFDPWLAVGSSPPGRMARNTALAFVALALGSFALAVARDRPRRVPVAVGIGASAVAGLVLVALFGYATGVSEAYTWRSSTAMAPASAFALLVASLGYGAAAWEADAAARPVPVATPRWLPVPVAVGTLAATLFLWQALAGAVGSQAIPLDRAALVTLGIGLLLAVLLGLMTAVTQNAAGQRRLAEERHQRDLVLREAYAAVALAEDLGTGFDSLAAAVAPALPFDRLALTLVDPDGARIVAVAGPRGDSVPVGTRMSLTEPIVADLLASRSSVLVADVAQTHDTSPAARAGMRSFVATPIVIGGSTRALLTIASTRVGAYDGCSVALFDELTELTGGALYTLARLDYERVTTARLRELDQLKNEFVGVVAHDLRSPMTVIAGYVDTMLQRWDAIGDDMKKDLLAVVSRNTKRLSTMVEDVLQVARIESGDFPYEIAPFDLGALVRRTVEEMNAATPGKPVRADVPPSLPTARGDEDRYWRVLTNLLSNAQKFSPPEQPVVVSVAARRDVLEVSVTDRGPGIPEEQLPRLFGKFSRLAGPPDGQKGTGLGLYICKALVEAQGGRIGARSKVGEGTTVTFTVPRTGEQ